MSPSAVVFGFLGSATVVVLAGIHLARAGDVIAARSQLGGLWVGALLLAVATSLPELATDVAAVKLGEIDLAAGDLFGSSLANMLILALVSLSPRTALFSRAALDNGLSAMLAIGLTAIASITVLLRPTAAFGPIGIGSLTMAVVYLAGMRAIFRRSATAHAAVSTVEMGEAPAGRVAESLSRAGRRFALAALVILLVAPQLARHAKALAEISGLGATFVGTWLVGLATSLPELVTSLAAVRVGAHDLAVGNLFGSNAINMVMFLPLDAIHGKGPILGAVAPEHALTGLVAIALMALGVGAVIYRANGRLLAAEPASLLMIVTYVVGIGLLYLQSAVP